MRLFSARIYPSLPRGVRTEVPCWRWALVVVVESTVAADEEVSFNCVMPFVEGVQRMN